MRRLFSLIRYLPPDAMLFVVMRAEAEEAEKKAKAQAPAGSFRELARSMKNKQKG